MCRILDGSNVLIVGDSLSEEFFETFVSTMLDSVLVPFSLDASEAAVYFRTRRSSMQSECSIRSQNNDSYPDEANVVNLDCGFLSPFRVAFARSNSLSTMELNSSGDIVSASWLQLIHSLNISLVVLNTGAHFNVSMVANLNNTLKTIYAAHPNISVIYRNTVPGHVDCDRLFLSPPLMSAQTSGSVPMAKEKRLDRWQHYHWFNFSDQNSQVDSLLRRFYPQVINHTNRHYRQVTLVVRLYIGTSADSPTCLFIHCFQGAEIRRLLQWSASR